MVGSSKKPKSKRASASKQYKIKKKVTEHHRKLRKEAKNAPSRSKSKKDPGIPNLFPMKERLLEQMKEARAQNPAVQEIDVESNLQSERRLENMLKRAEARSIAFQELHQEHEKVSYEPALEGRKDNSKKAYYKEFQKVVELSDVILQVLDARDPLGCRALQVEEYVMNAGASKRIILILNKIDLVPKDVAEKWLKYLRQQMPTVAFKASTQSQRNNISRSSVSTDIASKDLLSSSDCLGAENLMQLLKNYCRNLGMKTTITVGVIGFPNVGKSSVINSLKRTKVCTVGSTPGITKVAQEIYLDKNIKLLDCPGIVFGRVTNEEDKMKVLLRNCVKVELVEDPVGAVDFLLSKCKMEQLVALFDVPYCSTSRDFLIHLSRKRGKLRKGGIPDLESAARTVIVDWNAGKIPFYTVPPKEAPVATSSAILTTWSKEFKLTDLVKVETDLLDKAAPKGKFGKSMVAFTSGDSMEIDENAGLGDDEEEEHLYQFDVASDQSGADMAIEEGEEDDEDESEVDLPALMDDS
ncbi:Guanine nucleotide-binding protein-like 3 [Dinochytrium kinnereticum]|nr:Guanine nucleotide-binding protein-like 3 [Dinochytrium kinnereticum]